MKFIHIGAQWAWQPNNLVCPRYDSPNGGGYSSVRFREETRLYGISWQSSVKVNAHEVLFILYITQNGLPHNPGRILSTHHVGSQGPTMLVKEAHFNDPIVIPAGWYAWIWVDGIGSPHPVATEVQVTLWADSDNWAGVWSQWQ